MKKTLLLLLLLLLALGGIAWWMTQSQSGTSTVQESGDSLLPELDLNEIASIDILSPDGTNTVANQDGQWVLPSLNGYPANTEKIAEEINKLDQMKVGQSIRGGEALYEDLELGDDESTRLILKDKDGKALTTVYLGATREKEQQGNPQFGGGSFNVPDGQYVRVGDGGIVLTKDAIQGFDNIDSTWVEKEIANVAKTDMKEAKVSTTNGTYLLAAVGAEDYYLEGLRKGQEIDNSRAYSVLNALSYLNFSSVAGKDVDPAKTGLDRAQSFAGTTTKGLTYNVKVGGKDDQGDSYITVDAAAAPKDSPDSDDPEQVKAHTEEVARRNKEAEDFNQKHKGWVYTVSSFKADSFVKPLSELVKLQPETPANSGASAGGNKPSGALPPSVGLVPGGAGTPGGLPVPAPVAAPPSIAKPAPSIAKPAPSIAKPAPSITKPASGSGESVVSAPVGIASGSATPAVTEPKRTAPAAPAIPSAKANNDTAETTNKAGQTDAVDFDALRAELRGLKTAVKSADKALDSVKRNNRKTNRHPQARQPRKCQKKAGANLDDVLSGLNKKPEAEKPAAEKPKGKRKDRPAKQNKPGKNNAPGATALPAKAAPPPNAPPAKATAPKRPKAPVAKTPAVKASEKPAATPKPIAAKPKPVAAKPKPIAAKPKPVAAKPKPVAEKKADEKPVGATAKAVPPPLESETTTFDPDIPLARSYPLGTEIAPAPWEQVDEKEYILGTVTKTPVDDGGPPVVQTIPLGAKGDGKAAPARPASATPAIPAAPGKTTGTSGKRDPNLRLYNAPPGPRNPNIPIAPSRPFLR